MVDLRQGDCLQVMKELPDNSIDMILCDLPYGTTRNKTINGLISLLYGKSTKELSRTTGVSLYSVKVCSTSIW